tara:strand:+ start:258 stop:542 length:285 start_codon:yes stop_codon:yes gene_type:complete
MNNNLKGIIKERLTNRLEWKEYLDWILTHNTLQMQAKKIFYQDKIFLKILLDLYFLPLNSMKNINYFFNLYRSKRIEHEIEMLKQMLNENEKSK